MVSQIANPAVYEFWILTNLFYLFIWISFSRLFVDYLFAEAISFIKIGKTFYFWIGNSWNCGGQLIDHEDSK